MAAKRNPRTVTSNKSTHVDGDGAPHDSVKTPARLALDDAFLNHEYLRRSLTENLTAGRIESDKVSERVDKAFANLSLSRPAENDRSSVNHVGPDASTLDALKAVVNRRVEAIRKSDAAPTISVRERNTIVKWDKTPKSDDHPSSARSGSLKPDGLLSLINVGQSGPVFASAPSVNAMLEAERQAQKVLDEVVGNDNGEKAQRKQDEDRAAGYMSADELVAQNVNVQMKSVTAPEDRLTYGLIPNGANADDVQSSLLETFELRPGASDVTAYHDFHTLRIAFEHVWTRLFDGDLEKLGKQLYREYVGLKDFLGYDPAGDRPISSLEDLKWLINEIRSLSDFAQDAIPPQLTNGQAGGDPASSPKGASDVTSDVARGAVAVLTGGLSAVAEAAINEISRLGSKPIKHWDDLDGQALERGDRITATFAYNVGNAGSIELALQSDVGTHWKGFTLQIWDQPSGKFVNFASVTNANKDIKAVNGQQYYVQSTFVPSSLMPTGAIEFSSEQSPGFNLGRYILINLAEGDKLRDGARITFYWQDN